MSESTIYATSPDASNSLTTVAVIVKGTSVVTIQSVDLKKTSVTAAIYLPPGFEQNPQPGIIPAPTTTGNGRGNTTTSSSPVTSSPVVISSTTTNSSQSTTTATPAGNGKGGGSKVSGGAVAGAAIGCLIAGALIASVIAFLLFRRHQRRNRHGFANDSVYVPPSAPEKGPVATGTISIPQDSSAAIVENYLPPPTEDEQIRTEVSRLKDKINGHVQSYYHSGPGTNDQAAATVMVKALGSQSTLQAERIPALLAAPNTRAAVLRFAVAWIIISRLGLQCETGTSFLPWQVVSCVHAMPKTQMDDKPRMAFLSKWRQITSALLPSSYGQGNGLDASDQRIENVRKAAQAADEFLRNYANPNDQDRLFNLEEIMKRAVKLAYLLFSHPSFWKFDWTDPQGAGGLVIFPALIQLTNEAGTLLPRANEFTPREVVRI